MNADYFIHMGQKFAGERNWKAALEAFNRAIDLEKKDAEAYLGRGMVCLLYTSDAADDLLCVDLGGRRIIKKKQKKQITRNRQIKT